MAHAAIAPPPPSKADSQTTGRSLFDLLRSRDKLIRLAAANDGDDGGSYQEQIETTENELSHRLHSLDVIIRRRGLFNNDSERALSFYNSASERSSSAALLDNNVDERGKEVKNSSSTNNNNRRKRKGGSAHQQSIIGGNSTAGGLSAASYGIFLDSHSNNSPFSDISSSTTGGGGDRSNLDEGLIVTVLCRILGVTIGRRKRKKVKSDCQKMKQVNDHNNAVVDDDGDDDEEEESKSSRQSDNDGLIRVALSIISSICDHAKDGMVLSLSSIDSRCAFVEGDMIGSIGSSLLDALRDNLLSLYHHQNNQDRMAALIDSFRAAASVVTLLEMRLSRAERVISGLRDAAWLILNNLHSWTEDTASLHVIQQSATILLASLPLAGSSEGAPPSKIWAQCIRDGMLLIRWAIIGFFPMPTVDNYEAKAESTKHLLLWKEHERWLSFIANYQVDGLDLGSDRIDSYRARALQIRVGYLTSYIRSLIKMDGYPLHRANSFSSSTLLLPLDSLLDVSELLLSFPLAAERKYRSTKQRLRSSPVDGGLISPDAAMSISVEMRLCGHTLFDAAIESCRGGSGALSRGRRIAAITVANLQSSCSIALVASVDGKRGGDYEGQRIGWLRGSIPLRIKSIQMFHNVAISLGSGTMSSTGTAKSMSKALVLLGGCLLEQTQKEEENESGTSGGDEWGTLGERAKLVEISSAALASCVAAFGGLIPNNIRCTIDSILYICLAKLYSNGGSSIFAYSDAKRSILQLAMNCVTVPWSDGGRSSTNEIVRKVSLMLKNDPDVEVASIALSTLCVVDAFMTPRAPAILIATRIHDGNGDLTASEMWKSINETQKELQASFRANDAKDKEEIKVEKKASKPAATKSAGAAISVSSSLKSSKKSIITGTTKTGNEELVTSFGANVVKNMAVKSDDSKLPSENTPTNAHVSTNDVASDLDVEERPEDKSKDAGECVDKVEATAQYDKNGNKDDTEVGDNDDFSLDDFPEIVDEEPDEGDRI